MTKTPIPTKPYMVRAIYEWCVDNGFTPYLVVAVDGNTRVPMSYVKNGEIVFNINYSATKDLLIKNEAISFSARFNGVSSEIYIPMSAVRGIFARENGQGLFFEPGDVTQTGGTDGKNDTPPPEAPSPPPKGRPSLKVVK
ncbi:MAG: ClpXP protease specificity-enhancing factor [Methylophilaceae bacterium]|nr:ClpXP protease specificity-enhancing factor [Methylophilaceae bacterium]